MLNHKQGKGKQVTLPANQRNPGHSELGGGAKEPVLGDHLAPQASGTGRSRALGVRFLEPSTSDSLAAYHAVEQDLASTTLGKSLGPQLGILKRTQGQGIAPEHQPKEVNEEVLSWFPSQKEAHGIINHEGQEHINNNELSNPPQDPERQQNAPPAEPTRKIDSADKSSGGVSQSRKAPAKAKKVTPEAIKRVALSPKKT